MKTQKKLIAFFLIGLVMMTCSREFELDAQFAAVKMTPTTGLTTTEGGGTATIQVVLSYPPTSNVIVSLQSSNTNEGQIKATGAVCDSASALTTTNLCTVTFTPDNWNKIQNVVVVGKDDFLQDGNVAYTVTSAAPVTSLDGRYGGIGVPAVTITNMDDDMGAGIALVNPPSSGLVTNEDGGVDTFAVRLTGQPAGNVTLRFTSNLPGEALPSPVTYTFTPTTWNIAKTIIVTGQPDNLINGDAPFTITITVEAGSDAAYLALSSADIPSVAGTNQNKDAGKYIFVTASSYVGAPSGLGGVPGADAKCNADSQKPNGSTYKAIIGAYNTASDTVVRESGSSWVLAAGQKYYRRDNLLIGTTNTNGVLPFPLLHSFHTAAATYWTGLYLGPGLDTWDSTPTPISGNGNCSGTAGSAWVSGGGGIVGNGASTASAAINATSVICGESHNLLCAEQ